MYFVDFLMENLHLYVFLVFCKNYVFQNGGSNLLFVVRCVFQESGHVKHYFMALINGAHGLTSRNVYEPRKMAKTLTFIQ